MELARASAIVKYRNIRHSQSTLVEQGRFFAQLLADNVWPTQSALAAGIGESAVRVSRCLKASRLPAQLMRVLGEHRVTDRTSLLIDEIRREIGEAALLENAARLGVRDDLGVRAILTALQTDGRVGRDTRETNHVRVVAKPDENYLRVYVPNLANVRKNLKSIERALRVFFWYP
jgi:hypothetical protein